MKYFLFLFTFLISFIFYNSIYAAEVFFDVGEEVKVGSAFELDIKLNTDKQVVNSIDFVIVYDESLFTFLGYKDTNSVVKLWLESPRAENGKIYFTGIIPGGASKTYDSSKSNTEEVLLAVLDFKANKIGGGTFLFDKTYILKNDGLGTELEHSQKSLAVSVLNNKNSIDEEAKESVSKQDEVPPFPFEISFVEATLFGQTPRMIIFNTNDLDSGVKEYKIKNKAGEWEIIKSPHPVSKTLFSHNISIRAYDFYDNYQEESISIPGFIPFVYVMILILFVLLLSGIWRYKLLK